MEWTRVKAGHYRSVSPKKYVITLEGVGLFREGWRPSWRLRKGDGHLMSEHGSLRAAKSHAENRQRSTREGKKRILSGIRKSDFKGFGVYFVCIHEAGHMLVERMTSNRRIVSANCVPGGGFLGLVTVITPQGAVAPEAAKGMIMTGLAGDIATALVAGSERTFDWRSLNEYDKAALLEFGPGLCGEGDFDEFARSLAEETLSLLRANREPLHLLADTLLRRRELNERQTEPLLRRLDWNRECPTAA